MACCAALALAASGRQAAAEPEDAYFQLHSAKPGKFDYVRKSEIQAFVDVSPSHCIVILSNGEEIRAYQKCAPMTDQVSKEGLATFATPFGSVLLSPFYIYDLVSTNNSGCRLNLRNGRFVAVNLSCEAVHQALPRE
ncbi:hypothetical protein SAMN05444581_10729 [Methylocapsa palsarum]|uniref:Uncharacterized protein n=1 Tax=Methylocapsa palsarum TaxID=1612308 RepID=A0A1I3Z2L7_9HYPH|nr:hypothetical protein SAMN05444581_10729 [Methylocapsa palsarum]